MGVDYSGNYGIGVKVIIPTIEDENDEWFEDELGYLDSLLQETDYYYFQVGESSYTGGEDDTYVCLDKPFEDGYDITNKVNQLIEFLQSTNLEVVGKVDEVGGLRVW